MERFFDGWGSSALVTALASIDGDPEHQERTRQAGIGILGLMLRDGDPIAGLEGVFAAAASRTPLSPEIAAWACKCLARYLSGEEPTLDRAFGLAVRGRGNPKQRRVQHASIMEALNKVVRLQFEAHASLLEASTLVSSVKFSGQQLGASALRKHYRERTCRRWLEHAGPREVTSIKDLDRLLSEFPDEAGLEIAQIKRRIRNRFAKSAI